MTKKARKKTKAKTPTKAKAAPPAKPRKLTDLYVYNLKPRADRFEITDTAPGLRLRVFPSSVKSWCYLYRSPLDRKWTRLTLGQYPSLGVKAARRQASLAAARVAEKNDPAAEKKSQRRALDIARRHTVPNVVTEFMNEMAAHYSPTWRTEVERVLNREIIPHWRRKLITDIAEQDVADIQAAIRERGSPAMADSVVKIIKSLFKFARKAPRRYVLADPAAEIGIAKYQPRQRALSDDEIKLVWNACESLGTYGRIVRLLLLTGTRRDEIGHLRWDQTNLPERLLTVPPKIKTAPPHLVPLSEPAYAILKSVEQTDPDFVFVTVTGRKMSGWARHKQHLDNMLGKAVRAWHVHDLRRTCRTGLSKLRITRDVAEAVLGHAPPAIVGIYDTYDLAPEKRHALDAWAGHVMQIVYPEDNIIPLRG